MGFAEQIATKLLKKAGNKAADKIKEHHENAQHNYSKNFDAGNFQDKNAELPPLTILIYSHNIRTDTKYLMDGEKPWSVRKSGVINTIKSTTANLPSLVGLQEVKQNQLNDVLDGLGHEWTFFGVGRSDGKSGGEFAPILYKKDEWELLKAHTIWLSPTPDRVSKGWDAAYERTATFVLVKHKKLGKIVNYVNTHYDHKGKKAREESSKLLAEVMNKSPGASVLSGDFNSQENAEAYKTLSKYLVDTALTSKKRDGFKNTITNFKGEGDSSIDFIWAPKELPALRHAVLDHHQNGIYISDHRPVFTEFEV